MSGLLGHRGLLLRSGDPVALSIYSKIVAWWELDEASGTTVNDAHTNALHGTSSGMTVNQSGLAANLGTSYSAPSGNHYIDVPNTGSALSITGALSVMAWCKRNGAQANFPKLLWKRNGDDGNGRGNYMLQQDNFSNGGKAVFRVSTFSTNYDVLSASSLADATTYCLLGTRNGTSLNLYVNGALSNSNTSAPAGALQTGTASLRRGYLLSSADTWVGSHDQAAVFNAALDATEVAYLYGGGDGISYAALRAAAGF